MKPVKSASTICGCLAGVEAYLRVNPLEGTVTFVGDSGSRIGQSSGPVRSFCDTYAPDGVADPGSA